MNNPLLPYFSQITVAIHNQDGTSTVKRWRKTEAGTYSNIEHTYRDPLNRASIINQALMKRIH